METRHLLTLVLLLLAAPVLARAQAPAPAPQDLRARYQTLNALSDENVHDSRTVTPALAGALWDIVGSQALELLRDQPGLSAPELAKGIEALETPPDDGSRRLKAQALPLVEGEHAAFAVAANWATMGTFLVLARSEAGWRIAWNMWEVGASHFEKHDELGRWAYLEEGCHDGRLTSELYPLPSTSTGHPRFLVRGMANTAMGGDWPEQLSVWEWTGSELRSQLIAIGILSAEMDPALSFEGALVRTHTKEPMKSFFACGSCPELESVWTLDLSGDEARDLGRAPVTAELALVDELVDRIRHGAATSDLATEKVVRALRLQLPKDSKEDLGMITWSLERHAKGDVLHLQADRLDRPLDFTFARRNGRLIAIDLRVARHQP